VLRKATLAVGEIDLDPIRGPEAVSLVFQLSKECWALGGRSNGAEYQRVDTPYRFVPWAERS